MSELLFGRAVSTRGGANPDAPAVIDATGVHSWADVERRVREIVIDDARRLALLVPQTADAIALLVACERADVIVVSAVYGTERARRHATELGASVLVEIVNGETVIVPCGDGVAREEAAILVLTSSTSGTPKCARHRWSTLAAAVRRRDDVVGARWFVGYPLAQFAGLQVLAQAVLGDGVLVVPPDFTPATAVAMMIEHQVDSLCATPSYARQLLLAAGADELARVQLRRVTLGGEVVDQQLLDGLARAFPGASVTHVYASTELGAIVSVRDGKVGFDAGLLDGETLRVVDGELQVRRTARAMLGYLGEATPDAWVATGDLVEVSGDRVHFRGRASDVFSVGGSKVNPLEVEAVIREVPGVLDVVVAGHASSILGALPKATVRGAPDAERAELQRAIAKHCAARLPAHMVPRLFEFADAIERTPAQKVRRP